MNEIRPLVHVDNLWEVWSSEPLKFTPWLVENKHYLEKILDFKLKDLKPEKYLSIGGYVDILAHHADTDDPVVIENQLGWSDQSHCVRLLGYAANAEAKVLVWVARDFTPYYQSILEWLNETKQLRAYAIAVRAYRSGKDFSVEFQPIVEPEQEAKPHSKRETLSTLCAEFYRPVIERLKQEDLLITGKHRFAGRFRSFQSGVNGIVYGTHVQDNIANVFLCFGWTEQALDKFKQLRQYQEEIDVKIGEPLDWMKEGEYSWEGFSHIVLKYNRPFTLIDSDEDLEPIRQWVTEKLLLFREVFQIYF